MLRMTTIEPDEEIENFDSVEVDKQPIVSALIHSHAMHINDTKLGTL